MKIPKIIHQIWIGPKPAPSRWMRSWRKKNPDWKYILWDNNLCFSRTWRNQKIIDFYIKTYNTKVHRKGIYEKDVFITSQGVLKTGSAATYFAWHVIADVLRYEILHEYGGFMPGADSQCLFSVNTRFNNSDDLFLVNTGCVHSKRYKFMLKNTPPGGYRGKKLALFKRYDPMNCAPVSACSKGHWFLDKIILELGKKKTLGEAVDTTGNVFMGDMIKKYNPKAEICNYKSPFYLKYSRHFSATTKNCYHKGV